MTSPALNYDSKLADSVHITPQEFRAGYDPALLVDKPPTPSRNDSQPTNGTHDIAPSTTAHLQRDAEKGQPLPEKVPFFKTQKGVIVIVIAVIVVLAAAIGGGVGGSKKKGPPQTQAAATGGGPGGNPVGPSTNGTFVGTGTTPTTPQTTVDQGVGAPVGTGTAAPPATTPAPGGGGNAAGPTNPAPGGGGGDGGGVIGQPPITLPVQPPGNLDQAGQVPGSGPSS